MNKKVMAMAVAGALVVPAAALAQVQIGGSLTVFYYQHDPDNASVGQKGDILESSEPEIYVRAEEKLGGGLSAWFQCTSSMDAFITGSSTAQGWCARNSGVGFRGGFGNFFVGNWDQPQKLIFNRGRGWFGGTNAFTGGSAVLLNGGSASGTGNPVQTIVASPSIGGATGAATVITNNPGTFFRRQASSLNYHSPSWGGFSILAAYSADNESTGRPESSLLDPRMYSLGAQFATGPFYVGVGYENHDDYNPGNVGQGTAAGAYGGGSDSNITAVLGLRMGGFDVRAMYSKSEYETTNTTSLDLDGFGVFADWNIAGPHTLRAQYVMVGDTSGNSTVSVGSYKGPAGAGCGTTSNLSCATATGADLMAIFYSYAMSKRTEVSVGYSQLANDSRATFSKGKTASSAGGTQKTTGLVLRHRF
jgi:predicted porin